jgi:phosphoribosyl 1,2-cyclic phosphodiesterase
VPAVSAAPGWNSGGADIHGKAAFTVLGSGSRGNCSVLDAGGEALLIDAGFSCREMVRRLGQVGVDPSAIKAVVVTHEHTDHVRGLRVFARKYAPTIYLTPGTHQALGSELAGVDAEIRTMVPGNVFNVGPFDVLPFPVSHDAAQPVGLSVSAAGRVLGYATDLGQMDPEAGEVLKNSDILVLESNHDLEMLKKGPYPWFLKQRILSGKGHLSNDALAHYLAENGGRPPRELFLAHISQENNERELASFCSRQALHRIGAATGVRMTWQDRPSDTVELF